MKLLFKIAFENRKHMILLVVTLFAMLSTTMATQMEMFSLKLMTSGGADFFELFADKGQTDPGKIVHTQIDRHWNEIDREGKGEITRADAETYLRKKLVNDNWIDWAVDRLDYYTGVLSNFSHLVMFLLCVGIFKALALFSSKYATRLAAIRVSRDLRQRYFEHIQSLQVSFYEKHNSGGLSSRVVSDAFLVAEGINSILINFLQTPFTLITTVVLCFLTSWKLTVMIFFAFPLLVIPMLWLARLVKRISKQLLKNQENFSSLLVDFFSGMQTVKIFAMEKFSLKKYQQQNIKMAKLEERGARYDAAARPITHCIASFFLAATLIYGLYIEQIALSQLLFFCGLLLALYEPVKKFAEENLIIQRGIAAAERMFEVLNQQPSIQDKAGAVDMLTFEHSLEFRNVWFKYGEEWILKDVSFSVKRGETFAIVGPTGSGKSTILQLIPRLYDIQKGEILIDGRPLQDYTQKSIREAIAFVPQRPFLFLDTVAENIAFGRDYTKEQIREAARRAYADEFIQNLPEGYDTYISEGGKNLSGGQQQRLVIARALIKGAPVMMMDEATSSLDAISEGKIRDAIEHLHGQITQIIVAHRFSTIQNADRILFLDKGEKVAEGSRDELLQSCASFREMWEMMNTTQAAPTK